MFFTVLSWVVETSVVWRKFLFLFLFLVSALWFLPPWDLFTFPEPVSQKRFFVLLCVFCLGISLSSEFIFLKFINEPCGLSTMFIPSLISREKGSLKCFCPRFSVLYPSPLSRRAYRKTDALRPHPSKRALVDDRAYG